MERKPRKPFVLIVEDDLDIAAYFQSVMDMAGYRTDVAVNGHQALEILFTTPPDIILLDLSLPGLNGSDILLILHSDRRFANIRTVVITGYSQMANELPLEPDLILEKPVSPAQLTELVKRLCQDYVSVEMPIYLDDVSR